MVGALMYFKHTIPSIILCEPEFEEFNKKNEQGLIGWASVLKILATVD